MEYQEQLYSEWRSSTAKVFWGIVLASVFSIFSNFYDMVSWIGSLGEMIYEHSQTGETSIFNSKFFWIGVGAKMLIIIGYVLYIVGLTQFAQIQQKGSTAHYVYKARTSVILLIITCVISIIFGFVSNIPFIGVFFVFVIWLMYVITYFIMKHAYDGMMMADDFGGRAKLGAKNVRYAAVCQLRLLFMPLVILVVALLYVLIAGASIYGMREELARMAMRDSGILEGGAIMIVLPALVMGVVAIICAIVWAICSFIWPMMGWFRIMSDGPADVMILVQQNQSDDEPISEMQTVIQNNNINPTLKSDNEPPLTTDAFPLKSNNELAGSPQKKWYYIGGGLLVALLVGILSLFLFKGCNTSDNLLNVQKPSWEKFVMVNSEDVLLYKEPSATSPKLMWAMENTDTDMCDYQFRWEDEGKKRGYTVNNYELTSKTVLPVLADAGGWYKVHVESAMAGTVEAYINKKWCQEVKPQPITEDVLLRVIKSGIRCDYLINKGKLRGLCFSDGLIDIDQEGFEIGQLNDGILIFPETKSVSISYDNSADMIFKKGENFDGYVLTYGEGRAFKEDENSKLFDTHTLTEKEAEEIYNAIKIDNPKKFVAYYYFPDADADHLISFTYNLNATTTFVKNEDDQPEEGVKNYTVIGESDDNPQQELMADVDEETVTTGIVETYITIIEEFDDDGDGYHEALICETCGGSGCPEKNYFVYYDKDSRSFKQTDIFKHYSQPEKEDWNGKASYVQRYGLHTDRYVFENHQLRQVEDKTKDVGVSLRKWTRESLFNKDTEESKTVHFDIDEDGTEEVLTLTHFTSHLYEEGECMSLDKITWESGREANCPGMYTGRSLTILESITNGMHDILIGDAYLYRWNGKIYVEWEWDGEKLVKSQNDPSLQNDDI